jgi:tripeptidyl-peptidase-2
VDTSKIVKADEDGFISGASGAKLQVNKGWKNPTGEWRVGSKLAFSLFTDTLTSRLKVCLACFLSFLLGILLVIYCNLEG